MDRTYNAGLYCRLSKDDDRPGESMSMRFCFRTLSRPSWLQAMAGASRLVRVLPVYPRTIPVLRPGSGVPRFTLRLILFF